MTRSPVDELINNDDITRLNLFPQGTAGCGHYDVCAALLLQSPDVRLVVDFRRHDGMLSPVPVGRSGYSGTVSRALEYC